MTSKKRQKGRPAETSRGTPSRPIRPPLRWTLLCVMVITATGIVTYSNTFGNPFFFDDDRCIVRNESLTQLWPIGDVLTAKPKSRPFVNLSLAINYAISKHEVWSYHAFNLAVHILATITLFGIVRRTLTCKRLEPHIGRSASALALAVAMIWALHPLQTAAVTYVIQRAESMMGLFYLLTLYSAIRSFSASVRWRRLWYLCAVAACALGMGSKQVMITAPLMVLLYDRTFVSGSFKRAVRRHWLLHITLAATWVLLWTSFEPLFQDASAGFGMRSLTPVSYAATQFGVILHYLRLSFFPVGLCLDYRWPVAETVWQIVPQGAFIVGLLALTVWALWRRPAAGFAGAWFFGILSVSSTIIPIADLAVDHRMYLSLAGVVAIVVVGGYVLTRAVAKRTIRIERMQKFPTALGPTVVISVIVVILAVLSHRRNQQYGEAITMWADVVANRPDNARAHYNLGRSFLDAGRDEEAIGSYNAAIRLESNYASAHCSLGNALIKTGRLNEALGHYRIAIQYKEMFEDRLELAIAYTNLAKALAQLNRLAEAVSCYRTAIDLKSDFAQAQYDLASTLCTMGRYGEAVKHFELAIKNAHKLKSPVELASAHNNLANALAKLGKDEEAIEHYRRAVEVNPDHFSAYINLAHILTRLGRYQEAIPNYRQGARLQPDNVDVLYALGMDLEKLGKTAQAVEAYDRALQGNPTFPRAMNKLAWILATCPDPTVRDGNRALALAEKLCTASRFRYAPHLDALAAAYAETGQFERAVAAAKLAIKLTGADEALKVTQQRQGRVQLYQQNQPLRIEQ